MSKILPTLFEQALNPRVFLAQRMKNNRSLQRAIRAARADLLKDPARGFAPGNINVVVFLNREFTFRLMGENDVRRIGRSLLRMWYGGSAAKCNERTIIAFLKGVGFRIRGQAAYLAREEHYQNNEYMREAVQSDETLISNEDRFRIADFLRNTFYFRDSDGVLFKFGGETLFRKRGEGNILKANVIAMLKEIGIEFREEAPAPPPVVAPPKPPVAIKKPSAPPKTVKIEALLADDDFVVPPLKTFIHHNRRRLLMSPLRGFQSSNIVMHRFPDLFSATHNGAEVTFTLKQLLKQRGYPNNTNGIAALFRDLRIN